MERTGTKASLGEELRHNLQIGLATGLIGGCLMGFLGAAASLAMKPELLSSFGNVLHLLVGLQLVYALLCLALGFAGAGLKTLFFLLTGRSISDTKTSGFAAFLVFFLIGGLYSFSWVRWQKIGGLAPGAPPTWQHAPILLAVGLVSALLAGLTAYAFYLLIVHYKKPDRRRPGDLRRAFLILAYMGGAFLAFLGVARMTAGRPSTRSGLTRDLIHAHGDRVRLLAIDGMSAEDLASLRAAGRLAWLDGWAGGTDGDVTAPTVPVPPIDWTRVATGQDLGAHGIQDFQARVVRGLPVSAAIGPEQLGLFELAQSVLPFFRLTRSMPVKSWMREAKGVWNIASDAGRRSVVVNWWVSWPAERVRGAIVSDHAWMKLAGPAAGEAESAESEARIAARVAASVQTSEEGMIGAHSPLRPDGRPLLLERETWPSTLLVELVDLARPELPDSLGRKYGPPPDEAILRRFQALGIPADALQSDAFYARTAAWLAERESPDLWMLHLPGPDVIRRVLARRDLPAIERERIRREALDLYWTLLDAPVGRICRVMASDPGPVRLLLTLPGLPWPEETNQSRRGYYAVDGPGVNRQLAASPLSLDDVTPTVLWILGLPSARDLPGTPRLDWWTPEATAARMPLRWIATYGRQETEGLEEAAGTLDQEMLERFRSLGYIH